MSVKRPVVLDGANIAYCYDDDISYETKGILLAAEYFIKLGHKPYIVVHHSRTVEQRLKEHTDMTPKSKSLMLRLLQKTSDNTLMENGLIVPSRKNRNLDDDEFILSLAVQHGGFVISRDNFIKQGNDYPDLLPLIKNRVLDFTFCWDVFHLRVLQEKCLDCYDDDPKYKTLSENQLTTDQISRTMGFLRKVIVLNELQYGRFCSEEFGTKDSYTQTDEKHDFTRRKGTITFTVPNFKAFTLEGVGAKRYSPIEYYRGIPWRICIQINNPQSGTHKQVGVYLSCESWINSSHWTCEVTNTVRIVSQKDGIDDHINDEDDVDIFSSNSVEIGYVHFMGLHVLLNPCQGYIKDDTVIFEIDLKVKPPQ